MNTFHELINGKGIKGFLWEVVKLTKNDGEVLDSSNTYADALAIKLNSQLKDIEISIELYYYPEFTQNNEFPTLMGDESNFIEIQNKLHNFNINN